MSKILLIDDEEIIRRRLENLLTLDGYKVFLAESGQKGLEVFEKEKPEVVLVDVKMPGMDGIEVLERVKKASQETDVIVITGHGGMETSIDALRRNAFDYITKPINYDELEISIKRALEKQKMFIENRQMQGDVRRQRDELKKRAFELQILYDVSSAISYTLDYQQLFKLIMEALFKIVDYDICASLLFDTYSANIILKPAYIECAKFVDEVKQNLISADSLLTGENIRSKHIRVVVLPALSDAMPKEKRKFDKIRSFFNVPFVVRGKTIGMINVSSCRDNAFSEDEIKLIYTIANQASSAIERLQTVITAEKSKMESMVESMTEGVIMIDERDEIVVFNPQCRYMLGFNITEEITFQHLIEKMKAVGMYDAFQDCQNEKRLVTKDISIPWGMENAVLRCDMAPVKEPEGDIIGMVTILRDITKENELDKMKSEFLSTFSHELRTPLSAIIGYSEALIEEMGDAGDDTWLKDIEKIHIAGDSLLVLINGILDLSKIEAGRMELFIEEFGLQQLLKEIETIIKPLVDIKTNRLTIREAGTSILLRLDRTKVRQILLNLLSNSCKFTEAGEITLSVSTDCSHTKFADDRIIISIKDSGIGMTAEQMKNIFLGFYQADGSTTRKYGGTGLGLTITKRFCEMMNGSVDVQSIPNEGTTFTVTLPINYEVKEGTPSASVQVLDASSTAVKPDVATVFSINGSNHGT